MSQHFYASKPENSNKRPAVTAACSAASEGQVDSGDEADTPGDRRSEDPVRQGPGRCDTCRLAGRGLDEVVLEVWDQYIRDDEKVELRAKDGSDKNKRRSSTSKPNDLYGESEPTVHMYIRWTNHTAAKHRPLFAPDLRPSPSFVKQAPCLTKHTREPRHDRLLRALPFPREICAGPSAGRRKRSLSPPVLSQAPSHHPLARCRGGVCCMSSLSPLATAAAAAAATR